MLSWQLQTIFSLQYFSSLFCPPTKWNSRYVHVKYYNKNTTITIVQVYNTIIKQYPLLILHKVIYKVALAPTSFSFVKPVWFILRLFHGHSVFVVRSKPVSTFQPITVLNKNDAYSLILFLLYTIVNNSCSYVFIHRSYSKKQSIYYGHEEKSAKHIPLN